MAYSLLGEERTLRESLHNVGVVFLGRIINTTLAWVWEATYTNEQPLKISGHR